MGGWSYYPLTTLPAYYDIVWCWFPDWPDSSVPGPKPRPALVLKTGLTDPDYEPEVFVAYGSARLKTDFAARRRDFFVYKFEDVEAAGLPQATRFDADRRLWLPWSSEFFSNRSGFATPVIGQISQNSQNLLRMLSNVRENEGLRRFEDED